jgi:Phage tail assembly chaperone
MAKLKLVADPTFRAKVPIPVAGSDAAVDVLMTFRHRKKSELEEFIKTRADKTDADTFMDMVTAWELEDEFNRANAETLLENYMGAGLATFRVYIEELAKAKLGN